MFLVSRRGLAESSPALQCVVSIMLKRKTTRPTRDDRKWQRWGRNFTWSGNITAIDRPWRDRHSFRRLPRTEVRGYFQLVPSGTIPALRKQELVDRFLGSE
jgi:hypothetical protein